MSDVKEEKTDLLCGECGETFSNFLQEMADQNAKVTTCPKCGKVHAINPREAANPVAGASPARKKI
jgi:DNA-directed RNA polymerase subunit RPC12/RpoP